MKNNGFYLHIMKFIFFIILVSLISESLYAQVQITIKKVEQKKDNASGQVAVDITYDIQYNNNDNGTTLQLEVSTDNGATFDVKPQGKEVVGDVNTVKGNGTKLMTWFPLLTASITPAKYDKCIAQIKIPGGEPTGATINIGSFSAASWKSTGVVTMSAMKRTNTFKPTNGCTTEKGTFSSEPSSLGGVFYQAGSVKNFPDYEANVVFAGPMTGQGCSSFIAVTGSGTDNEEIWINFTNDCNRPSKNNPDVTLNWEAQIRFMRKKDKAYEAVKIGEVDRNGNWFEVGTITNYNVNIYYDGSIETFQSDVFQLNLAIKTYTYSLNGTPILEFTVTGDDDKAYWVGAGDGKIKNEGHVVTINNFLKFSGSYFLIDTVNSNFEFDGQLYLDNIPDLFSNVPLKLPLLQGHFSSLKLGKQIIEDAAFASVGGLVLAFKLAGVNAKPFNVTFIDGTNATGIKLDLDILVDGFSNYCGNDWKILNANTAAIRFLGVTITNQGIGLDGINVQNIGLMALPSIDKEKGGACIKSLSVVKNTAEKSLECSILLKFPPVIEEIAGNFKLINGKLDAFGLKLKIEAGYGVPLPEPPPPAHIIEWQGFEGQVKGIVNPPFEMSPTILFTNNTKVIPKEMNEFAKIFEYAGTFHLRWPDLWEFTANAKFFKIFDMWVANAEDKMSLMLNPFTMSRYGAIRFWNLGGSAWMFDGTGGGSLCFLPFLISMTQTGTLTVPDLFSKNTYFTELNRLLKLPWKLGSVTTEIRNAKFGAGIDFSAVPGLQRLGKSSIIIDMTKGITDFSFIKISPGVALNMNSTLKINDTPVETLLPDFSHKEMIPLQASNEKGETRLSATDTTFVSFISNNNMTVLFVSLFGSQNPNHSVLIDPAKNIITGTKLDSSIVFYPDDPDYPNHSMWVIYNPAVGNWKLGIINKGANDSLKIFAFTQPRPDFTFNLNNQGTNVTMTWDPSGASDSSTVDIYIDSDTLNYDGIYVGSVKESAGTFTYQLSDSLANCYYYFYAKRWDNDVVSKMYNSKVVQNPKASLPPPQNIAIISDSKGHTTISWSLLPTDTNVVGYKIDVIDGVGNDSTYATVNAFIQNQVSIDIQNYLTKKIIITAFNSLGQTGCPSVPLGIVTNVEEQPFNNIFSNDGIEILPNPASSKSYIYVNISSISNLKLGIYDIFGVEISTLVNGPIQPGVFKSEWDGSAYPSGIYFVRLVNGNDIRSRALILLK
jgi:hypothetical protein